MKEKEINMETLVEKKMNTFVGYCKVELVDNYKDVMFPMSVMYPTYIPGRTEKLGPFSLNVSKNAKPKEGIFPLILISHGSGGSHLLYRTLAYHLASNGFIVGMPEHPFNNKNNNTLVNTVENLINRPTHLRIAMDWFFDSNKFKRYLKPDSVSIIGHSMGGYTALAVAGGKPTSLPHELPNKQSQQISVLSDHRIKALVLLAPATVWFMGEGSLREVDIPILMFTAEKDEYTPGFHAQIVLQGVSDKMKIEHRIVENANHFSFLSPFPESMNKVDFPPSQDPIGFNRESFHYKLNDEVLDFLLSKA